MSEIITLKQYDGQIVTPKDDALLYDLIVGRSGLISGCELTDLGAGKIRISAGRGIIKGRMFEVLENTINVTLAEEGTLPGRLYLHMDLSDTESPIRILHETAEVLTELVCEEDCNETSGIYEIELGTYTANVLQIAELRRTADVIEEIIGDMANVRYNEDTDYLEVLNADKWVQTTLQMGLLQKTLFLDGNNAGGFAKIYTPVDSNTTITVNMENSMNIQYTNAYNYKEILAVRSDSIDLTGYKTLTMEHTTNCTKSSGISSYEYTTVKIGTSDTNMVASKDLLRAAASASGVVTLDVSALEGNYYIYVVMGLNTGTTKVAMTTSINNIVLS